MDTGVGIETANIETDNFTVARGAVRPSVRPLIKPATSARQPESAQSDTTRSPDNSRPAVLARCTGCGELNTISVASITNTPAHKHLLASLLCLWSLLIAVGALSVVAGQVSTACITLFGLTTHAPIKQAQMAGDIALPQFRLTIKPVYREYPILADLMLIFPFALAFLSGIAAAGIFRHWKWWGYALMSVLQPAISMGIVYLIWTTIASDLIGWAATIVQRHAVAQFIGCLLGIVIGRRILRPLVRIVLPARFHNLFTYLWPTPTA